MTHMPGTLALVRGPLQCQVAARCAFARVRRGRLETFQQPWNEILYLPRERKTTSTTWIDTRQCKLIHGSIKRPLRGVCIPARRSAQPVRSSSRTAWSDKSDMRAMLAMSTSSAPPPGCTCTACARGGGTVSVRAWQGSAAAAGAGKFLETFLLGLGHKLGGGVGGGQQGSAMTVWSAMRGASPRGRLRSSCPAAAGSSARWRTNPSAPPSSGSSLPSQHAAPARQCSPASCWRSSSPSSSSGSPCSCRSCGTFR